MRRDCDYTPDGDIYTRPGALQIVLTGVDGGTGGSEVKITQERSVSRSSTFEAGVGFEVFSASVSITFEETITNSQEKTFTIPAGQSGKLGFTPTLKCTKGMFDGSRATQNLLLRTSLTLLLWSGSVDCGDGPQTGEACTGYEEAGEIAGTYAVIAIT